MTFQFFVRLFYSNDKTTLKKSHTVSFQHIFMIIYRYYRTALNYVCIDFQGQRSKFKVTGSKTLIFTFSTITKEIFHWFSLNENQNTWHDSALMPIVGLGDILKIDSVAWRHKWQFWRFFPKFSISHYITV